MELFTPAHLLIISLIFLFFFGAKRLPELGRGVGDGVRVMRDALRGQTNPTNGDSARPKK